MKHSIRHAKITLYLDVPTADDKNHFISDNEIVSLCEDAISKISNFSVNAPSDIITGPVESDDLEEMIFKAKENNDNVAGFLAPDGKWWLTYCSKESLAHISLSSLVYSQYKYELAQNSYDWYSGIDSTLEHNGFVKVHGSDIRYFSNVGNSPKVNSKQIDEILKYVRLQLDYMSAGYVCINGKIAQYNKMKQMDEIAFNKLFEI